MADVDVEIPHRALFKPSEVCELAKIQPYVLRSWELEFPSLGIARAPGGPRLYRKPDVELVLRIKHLVFGEGLTVAGARRTIEEDGGRAPAADAAVGADLFDGEVKRRLVVVRRELQSIFDLLSGGAVSGTGEAGDSGERVLPAEGRLPLGEMSSGEAPVAAGAAMPVVVAEPVAKRARTARRKPSSGAAARSSLKRRR